MEHNRAKSRCNNDLLCIRLHNIGLFLKVLARKMLFGYKTGSGAQPMLWCSANRANRDSHLKSNTHADVPSEDASDEEDGDVDISGPSVEELIQRSQTLLDELQAYKEHLESQKLDVRIEIASFRGSVKSELNSLKRLAARSGSEQTAGHGEDEEDNENGKLNQKMHSLRSSNVPFLEALWATAKRSRGVIAFSKRFYWQQPGNSGAVKPKACGKSNGISTKFRNGNAQAMPSSAPGRDKRYASVDIVAESGVEWIKISSTTQKRLLFELAGQGWPSSSEGSDREDVDEDNDDEDKISLVRMAESMVRASKATRCHYRHPRIRFVLPKIVEGRVPQVDSILKSIRRMGITVETSSDLPNVEDPNFNPPISLRVLSSLSPDPFTKFTSTLNMDCTVLLALVSDLSHTEPKSLTPQPWHHRALLHQMEREHEETLLPSVMYAAMGGRELFCTEESAVRMREIVETIGTPTEKARTALLLGDNPSSGENKDEPTRPDLLAEMQRLSDHPVPPEWQLPIRIIQKDSAIYKPTTDIPEDLLEMVNAQLTTINQSVFVFGWRNGLTTLSSNRTVAKQIERVIGEWLDGREATEQTGNGVNGSKKHPLRLVESANPLVGPEIWLCGTSRSLIGKEKGRK